MVVFFICNESTRVNPFPRLDFKCYVHKYFDFQMQYNIAWFFMFISICVFSLVSFSFNIGVIWLKTEKEA